MKYEVVTVRTDGNVTKRECDWRYCVAIGYAGRDQASVIAHVEELKAIGVPAPEMVPSMYWMDPTRMSPDTELSVIGGGCSGEVEFFAVFDAEGKMHFTIASDHTDRHLETVSVSKAKQGCSKIIGNVFWSYEDVKDHWDEIQIRSWITEPGQAERPYQNGTLGGLLPPEELYALAEKDVKELTGGGKFAYFSGTVPPVGKIAYHGPVRMELSDPVLKRSTQPTHNVIE